MDRTPAQGQPSNTCAATVPFFLTKGCELSLVHLFSPQPFGFQMLQEETVRERERWGLDLTDCPFQDGLSWLVVGNAGRIAWTRSSVAWTAGRQPPLPPVLSCSFPGASSRSCRFWIWIGGSQTLDHTCWVADLSRVQNPGYKKKYGETNKLSHRCCFFFCFFFFFEIKNYWTSQKNNGKKFQNKCLKANCHETSPDMFWLKPCSTNPPTWSESLHFIDSAK